MSQFGGRAAKRQRTSNDGGKDKAFNGGSYRRNFKKYRGGRGGFVGKPSHILHMTVMNPAFPITTDVIHTICSPSGNVLRIVIFKKNGVQAMVEFDSSEAAERAKQSLNGCDIYSGCCTLRIEFAKTSRLNVHKNDNDSWDYTDRPHTKGFGIDRRALLQEPPRPFGPGNNGLSYVGGINCPPYNGGFDDLGPRGLCADSFVPAYNPYGGAFPPDRFRQDPYRVDIPPVSPRGPGFSPGGPMNMPPVGKQQSAVMMAYNLNHEKMNCDKLFNILCLYGNIVRVKFLKSKEGCGMIQMGDPLSVERAVSNLNGRALFGTKLQLGYSKQAFLNDVQQPFELPDGTPSSKDYLRNRNNRFTNPEASSKNRILPPSNILHFYNAPVGITEEEVLKIFEDRKTKQPSTVKVFQSKKMSERSSSGVLEFDSIPDALEALALCNHVSLPNSKGKRSFVFKLCFSSFGPGRGGH